ncbi:DUF7544 domain-containing protein [Halomarina oriensis]|uniref:Glycerophosphoryl diester phosphodiesterase membrane domain-containing protein n=1 Tax=Halomarina oriensis TaxID=671145 RepID=A0A6B0GQL7_9EURY|nr:hypothetical protein [Halomarina oriensis]MWG36970.1 hypothetical protein [Halomarina oriensis]
MVLYALDDLDDAYAATRRFLFPFDWRRWLGLAFVAFFVASSTGTPSSGVQFTGAGGGTDTGTTGEFSQAEFDAFVQAVEPLVPLVVGVVVATLLLALLFAVVGAVMEFVLVQSLREDRVAVREFFGRYWRKGVRLFGFRLGLGFLAFLVGVLVFGLTVGPLVVGLDPVVPLVALVVLAPLFVLFALAVAAVGGFTTAFVVPIMLLEDRGVLSAWRRLWPTVRSQWRQFAVYALVVTVVLFALGLVAGIVVAIPVALVGAVLALVLGAGFFVGGVTAGTVALAVVLGVPFVLFVLLVGALVQVPVQTYVRYHALLVLGDADERFDLIPDVRRSIREPGQGGVSGPTSAD